MISWYSPGHNMHFMNGLCVFSSSAGFCKSCTSICQMWMTRSILLKRTKNWRSGPPGWSKCCNSRSAEKPEIDQIGDFKLGFKILRFFATFSSHTDVIWCDLNFHYRQRLPQVPGRRPKRAGLDLEVLHQLCPWQRRCRELDAIAAT